MRGRKFPHYSNRLYFRPGVKIVVEDGRSFVRRFARSLPGVAGDSGRHLGFDRGRERFALSENNLYTTEAFVDYLSHLTADGLTSFYALGLRPPARVFTRGCRLRQRRCGRSGKRSPRATWRWFASIFSSSKPGVRKTRSWCRDELSVPKRSTRFGQAAATAKMEVVYVPGDGARIRLFSRPAFGARMPAASTIRILLMLDRSAMTVLSSFTRCRLAMFGASCATPRAIPRTTKLIPALPVLFGLVAISIAADV